MPHLLYRAISPYTHASVLLGVFRDVAEAVAARDAYAARYHEEPDADPWREQAYRDEGLRPRDLVVIELPGPTDVDVVYVVSAYAEAFGQILRSFDSLHGSEAAALARAAELEQADDDFPHYAGVQRARVGVALSDRREDQPK